MFPLLALGLLAGSAYGQDWYNKRRDEETSKALQPLLGTAPEAMGPPTDAGQYGLSGGTGLLADPANPIKQMQFAQGLLAVQGGQKMLSAFDPMLGRAMASRQFTQQQEQQESQFQQGETRAADQFKQTFGLNQEQFKNLQTEQTRLAQQWRDEFKQREEANRRTAADAAARLALSQKQFGLEEQKFAFEKGQATTKGTTPSLPSGYMYAPSASGVVMAPAPGTQDYNKVVGTERDLVTTIQNVNTLMDLYLGEEKTALGRKIREGGVATEYGGAAATQMNTIRGQIISSMAKLNEMGVLDKGEREELEDRLVNPSSLWSNVKGAVPLVSGSQDRGFEAGYTTLRGQFERKLQAYREANPWLVPPPPKGTRPEKR